MRNFTVLIKCSLTALSLLATSCGAAKDEKPTKEIVEQVLRRSWEKAETSFNPKTTLEVNSVKFGKPNKATAQDVQVEGLPQGATVTPAIVDFSVKTFYTKETQVLRRVREAKVYKDKFDEWAVMTGSVRGQDERTTQPAAK